MEKSVEINFNDYMKQIFAMQEVDIREYSPLTLAYIGDSIYDLIIKSLVINRGNKQVQKLHKETSSLVQASAQSMMMRAMQEELTDEEGQFISVGEMQNPFLLPKISRLRITEEQRALRLCSVICI